MSMPNPVALGIDPGLHHTGIAVVDRDCIRLVGVLTHKHDKGIDAVMSMAQLIQRELYTRLVSLTCCIEHVVIEDQEIYRSRTKNPMDILRLGQVAGAAVGAALTYTWGNIHVVAPKVWKKQTPKDIHQERVLARYGVTARRVSPTQGCVPVAWPGALPVGAAELSERQWNHAIDAIGLARWVLMGKASVGEEPETRGTPPAAPTTRTRRLR